MRFWCRWLFYGLSVAGIVVGHNAYPTMETEMMDIEQRLKHALAPRFPPGRIHSYSFPAWLQGPWVLRGEIRTQATLCGVFLQSEQVSYYFSAGARLPQSTWRVTQVSENHVFLENVRGQRHSFFYRKEGDNHLEKPR